MGMKLRDEMRRALAPSAPAMRRTITAMRELGRHDLADELQGVLHEWVRVGDRGVRRASPHGRVVVEPIAGAYDVVRRPVGVEQWSKHVAYLRSQYGHRPALRVVPVDESARSAG